MSTPSPLLAAKTVDDLIKIQWNAKQHNLARQTEKAALQSSNKLLEFSCNSAEVLDKYLTHDPETLALKAKVMRLQCEDDSVLIVGPTGTGKEMIARALHGSRAGKFVAVNCTSLPDQLIESELFGYKKGAFTGADIDKPGKFEAAFDGTIFLDEIGDMPLVMQAKLLRVLQERVIVPLGSNKEVPIKCRVVAATNRNPQSMLSEKTFREDLYFRLSTFELKTKGLIDRVGDIAEIVDSLGGHSLYTEFERWEKAEGVKWVSILQRIKSLAESQGVIPPVDATIMGQPGKILEMSVDQYLMYKFFRLEGNVRSLQAQVRRWLVLKER